MTVTLTLTTEEFKVVWRSVQEHADNQPEFDDPEGAPKDLEVTESLRTRLDGIALDVFMADT